MMVYLNNHFILNCSFRLYNSSNENVKYVIEIEAKSIRLYFYQATNALKTLKEKFKPNVNVIALRTLLPNAIPDHTFTHVQPEPEPFVHGI